MDAQIAAAVVDVVARSRSTQSVVEPGSGNQVLLAIPPDVVNVQDSVVAAVSTSVGEQGKDAFSSFSAISCSRLAQQSPYSNI